MPVFPKTDIENARVPASFFKDLTSSAVMSFAKKKEESKNTEIIDCDTPELLEPTTDLRNERIGSIASFCGAGHPKRTFSHEGIMPRS